MTELMTTKYAFTEANAGIVVVPRKIVRLINFRHARNMNATAVNFQVLKVHDVNVFFHFVENVDHGIVLALSCIAAKVPVGKLIVRSFLEEVPVNETVRINKVRFKVQVIGHVRNLKAWRR